MEEISRREEELSKRTEEEVKNRQNLFKAKIQRNMGYLFWQLYEVEKKKEEGKNTSVLKELITLAIDRAKESFKYARELPEDIYKEDIIQCKNNLVYFLAEAANLVYFLAEAARIDGFELAKEDKEQALIFSNEILAGVSKQDYPDNYYTYRESCAWALQHLSEEEDKMSKEKASDIIRELMNDGSIPFSWRKRIKEKWAHFLKEENDISTSIKNT